MTEIEIPTCDPNCWIIEKTEEKVVYKTAEGEKWEIYGTCNQCGECEVGSQNEYIKWTGISVGQPNACYDVRGKDRPDSPVRPEISINHSNCSLSGKYL